MIDGSTAPVEENAALTQSVVKAARAFGVPVEAEIGELQRLDADGSVLENKNTVDPDQVRRFLELCSPDTLAIGIQKALNTLNHQGHSWKLSQYACNALAEDVKNIIRLSGSAGKA